MALSIWCKKKWWIEMTSEKIEDTFTIAYSSILSMISLKNNNQYFYVVKKQGWMLMSHICSNCCILQTCSRKHTNPVRCDHKPALIQRKKRVLAQEQTWRNLYSGKGLLSWICKRIHAPNACANTVSYADSPVLNIESGPEICDANGAMRLSLLFVLMSGVETKH